MMKRRAFVAGMTITVGLHRAVEAQPRAKVWRIAFLTPVTKDAVPYGAFLQGLRDLGYVEGRNIEIDFRSADGRFDRLSALATAAVKLKPDVIVAWVTHASLAAREATTQIPIVMIAVADPVASGLVSSLARPGGHITGNSSASAIVAGKSLELLMEVLPRVSRVGVLWNPDNAIFQKQMLRETESAALKRRVHLHAVPARNVKEIDEAFGTFKHHKSEALAVLADPAFRAHIGQIVTLATTHRLPSISGFREFAASGGLMAYGPDFNDLCRRAASYVDRILKGARPSDLPVEEPTRFELVINGNTVRSLGLKIPQSVLVRADQVID